jgi:hypothetical protein
VVVAAVAVREAVAERDHDWRCGARKSARAVSERCIKRSESVF